MEVGGESGRGRCRGGFACMWVIEGRWGRGQGEGEGNRKAMCKGFWVDKGKEESYEGGREGGVRREGSME